VLTDPLQRRFLIAFPRRIEVTEQLQLCRHVVELSAGVDAAAEASRKTSQNETNFDALHAAAADLVA
jgi:hypothetical protein